jgi:hypothetical protein
LCATQVEAWVQEERVVPSPSFDQANKETYDRYADSSWQEIEELAQQASERIAAAVEQVDEEALLDRSYSSGGRKLWQSIVQTAYSHKLAHFSEYYIERGMAEKSGQLWGDWVQVVSPLDPGGEWQGAVHYNAACSLALAGDSAAALRELKPAFELQPSLRPWSRQDSDLDSLHDMEDFKQLLAQRAWWDALEAGPIPEALADQFLRLVWMLREAVGRFDEKDWLQADTDYRRPAGLALHIVQTMDQFSSLAPGEHAQESLADVNWQDPDVAVFPSQAELLDYLARVESRLARFLSEADLDQAENQFPWTGSSYLSRALYSLRHSQHHLADMASELQRRGQEPPSWY